MVSLLVQRTAKNAPKMPANRQSTSKLRKQVHQVTNSGAENRKNPIQKHDAMITKQKVTHTYID